MVWAGAEKLPMMMPARPDTKSLLAAIAGLRSWYRKDLLHRTANWTDHLQAGQQLRSL